MTTSTPQTLGCAQCGELHDAGPVRAGDPCPSCGQGHLAWLDGSESATSQNVMLAWLLRDAHNRITGFGVCVGTVLALVVSNVFVRIVPLGQLSVALVAYLSVTGALAGGLWAPELARRLGGGRVSVRKVGDRKMRAVALGLWLVAPIVMAAALWLLGGGGPLASGLTRGMGVLWSALTD